MINNKQKSDRQYAAYLARNFFSGQISEHEILDRFPPHKKDFKMRLLYNRINNKKSWVFKLFKKQYKEYIEEIYEIIEDLESNKFRFKTMKRLLKELWIHSNNCSEPIIHISIALMEVAKSTTNSREEIHRYLDILLNNGYIIKISSKPLLYEFTEIGKTLKSDSDIEATIKTLPNNTYK